MTMIVAVLFIFLVFLISGGGIGLYCATLKNKQVPNISGWYVVRAAKLRALERRDIPAVSSIKEAMGYLGCSEDNTRCIPTFSSTKIGAIGFKLDSKIPVFVLTKNGVRSLSYAEVVREISRIDWEFEDCQYQRERS